VAIDPFKSIFNFGENLQSIQTIFAIFAMCCDFSSSSK